MWPVGAVSKTTTEKFIPFTSLEAEVDSDAERGERQLSSLRSGRRTAVPHDLGVAHGLVNAREGAHGLLHHLLAHAEHVVLLKELIGQLGHAQAGVDLLHSRKHSPSVRCSQSGLQPVKPAVNEGLCWIPACNFPPMTLMKR